MAYKGVMKAIESKLSWKPEKVTLRMVSTTSNAAYTISNTQDVGRQQGWSSGDG